MSVIEVKVPDIGDFKEVEVIELLVKPGDVIKVDQSLVTVESDKASMEIPSTHAGTIKELKIRIGDKVAEGKLLLTLEESGNAAPEASTQPAVQKAAAHAFSPQKPATAQAEISGASAVSAATVSVSASVSSSALPRSTSATATLPASSSALSFPHASPSIRKLAREFGVPLAQIAGSGNKGRITEEDVKRYVKETLAGAQPTPVSKGNGSAGLDLLPWPSLDFSRFGATELQPLSRIKKISGLNLHRNWVMIPHVTQFEEADITDLENFRQSCNASSQYGVKLTMLAFVMKACVGALKKFPSFNASLDEKSENLILKQYYHLGFAADTPQGLVVPVIKEADKKGIVQIAKEMAELSSQARDGKLKPADMQGASFTISSLGGIGGTAFTPIINAPEVAILGLSKSALKPVWDGKQFAPRLMLPLSLSYDHRVIDGAASARFAVYLATVLSDMRTILL